MSSDWNFLVIRSFNINLVMVDLDEGGVGMEGDVGGLWCRLVKVPRLKKSFWGWFLSLGVGGMLGMGYPALFSASQHRCHVVPPSLAIGVAQLQYEFPPSFVREASHLFLRGKVKF